MTFKTRKRLALLVLVVGMPLYVIIAATVLSNVQGLPKLVELLVYVIVGVAWILPFKRLFLGIAREDPDAQADPDRAADKQKAPR